MTVTMTAELWKRVMHVLKAGPRGKSSVTCRDEYLSVQCRSCGQTHHLRFDWYQGPGDLLDALLAWRARHDICIPSRATGGEVVT